MRSYKESMLKKHRGTTQKSEIYYDAYSHMFSRFNILDKLTILEIGVRDGGGLYTLKEHFPNAIIVGLDIDTGCKQWEDISKNIHVRIGDQSVQSTLQDIINEFTRFDIIIDDGSHVCAHQIKSFEFLFTNLNPAGTYVIEDLHTSYWKGFNDDNILSIDYFKELCTIPTGRWARNTNRTSVPAMLSLNNIESKIESIHFYDSICFINKIKHDIDLSMLISNYKQYFITQ